MSNRKKKATLKGFPADSISDDYCLPIDLVQNSARGNIIL